MVMGTVNHIVEVVLEKGSYNTLCTCYWSAKFPARLKALEASHRHVSESLGAYASGV